MVLQSELLNFEMATALGEGKLWIEMWYILHLWKAW